MGFLSFPSKFLELIMKTVSQFKEFRGVPKKCHYNIHNLFIAAAMREWTSLLSKALSLSINCNILKLFPQGSRHRSHHTQKVVPNVVARHQLLNTSPDNGIFPIKDMSRLMRKRSSLFSKNQNRITRQTTPQFRGGLLIDGQGEEDYTKDSVQN